MRRFALGGRGRYLLLFGSLFLGWGVLSPFLPAVLAERGATPGEIGVILGAGIAIRLLATPVAGALADRWAAPRGVLAALLLAGAASVLGYGVAGGFAGLLLVGLLHSAATGPVGALPDALAVRAAANPAARIDYGVVRGAGAAAFILGTVLAGQAVGAAGTPMIVLWLHAGWFALAANATLGLPRPAAPRPAAEAGRFLPLLALPRFRLLLAVTALIQGSHALYVGFATIRWQAAGLSPQVIGALWSIAVGSEVVVFLLLGGRLLARFGPGGLCVLAAVAGLLRWSVMAATAWLPAMLLAQPLHGLTFAAQHLAAMAVIARTVPPGLGATAQSLYGAFGIGLSGAVVTLASGWLYAAFGAGAFLAMAALCLVALPAAARLRQGDG